MATYVNDLRLKEIATGDESGTWGTSTNTNLELIAEAFSYGTEAITTNADTHTTTIADGATDPGRSMYLKYTGTLDSACTITIGPNTVSKMWFIENATSGSQSINISQGSGANVTIPAGETKVVYSDGAGAGAAITDAFASLKVSDAAQTNITSVGALDGGSITSGFGSIDVGSSAITTTGTVTGNTLAGTLSTAAQPNITSVGTLTGLDVAGTPTFDGLTVDGTATFNTGTGTTNNFIITGTDAGGSTAPDLVLFRDSASPVDGDNIGMLLFKGNNDAGTAVGYAGIFATINDASSTTEDGKLNFSVATANTESPSGGTTFMTIEGGGDISFYEDTGTTAKFFWDASAESLGIGTTSPSSELHVIGETRVEQTGAASRLVINRYDANAADSSTIDLLESSSQGASFGTTAVFGYRLELDGNTNNLNIKSGNQSTVNTRLSIERDTGNVGIGTDSPDGKLHIESSSSGATAGAGGDELILESSATTGLSILSGTANDGNILFGDSSNSAIGYVQYKHADNVLNFGVNGGTKATIDSSGKVGIGTTSPNYPLTVHSTGDGIKFEISDLVDANYRIQVSGNDIITGPSTGSDYIFQTSNTEAMRIDSSGNVGIGATTIDDKLHVEGSVDGSVSVKVQNNSTGSSSYAGLNLAGQGNNFTIKNWGDSVSGKSNQTEFVSTAGSSYFVFTNGGSERMRIDSSGLVGIGTSSPSTELHVKNSADCTLLLQSGDGDNAEILFGDASDTSRGRIKYLSSDEMTFEVNNLAEAMRIDSSGNVGIGTDSPATTLSVSGDGLDDSSPTIRLTNTFSSGSWQSFGGDIGRLEFFTEDTSGEAPYVTGRITSNNDALSGSRTLPSGALKFFTRGYNASSLTLAMTLSSGGALSKASGSFKIDHPLESKKDTHHLVHSFVEAPQADNIYRGVVTLVDGSATINLDTEAGMTEGTFVLLNTNTSCFTSNESDWDAVKGSVLGNILTISCQNTSSTATISWLVIGERHDQHMIDTDWTDENGKVIVEPLKGETE